MDTNSRINAQINAVIAYADEHEKFNVTFVESLQKQFMERGTLSGRQQSALDNICERFEIDY